MNLYFNIGEVVRFLPHSPSFPYLDGFTFRVTDYEEQGGTDHDHVWLECVENNAVQIHFSVNTTELELVNGHQGG